MRAYLVRSIIGVFALDENKKVISFKPFNKNPSEIADKLLEKEPREFSQIKNELKGFNFVTDDKEIGDFVKENLRKLAIEHRFVKTQIEFNRFLTNVNLEISKRKIKEEVSRDNLIVHVNNAIEELDKTLNIFVERLREWYSLYFPEMDRVVKNHEKFAEIIEKFGSREKIEDIELKQFAKKSMGIDFTEDDIKIVQVFATKILEFYQLKKNFINYLEKLLKEVAPNLTEIAGPMLAAKLISKAGGLEKLAKMASSTIQLLGSERALFRFLHGKGKVPSPKYGYIATHPLVQNSLPELKGKVARLLASKLSIAAKMDYYSKEYKADKLKKELEERVKEILSSK